MYEIKEVQKKAVELYQYFDSFCSEHKLRHYVIGGACIGAVRNNGFIPWDDDIDVFMPRPDYEKFQKLWKKYGDKDLCTYCRTNKEQNYKDAGSLLKLNNTTFINYHSRHEDIHHGYMMDIIPIDGCAPTKFSRMKQKIYAATYSIFNVQRLPQNQTKIVKYLTAIILTIIPFKSLRYHIWKYCEKQMSKYSYDDSDFVTELVTGFRYMNLEYPKEIFNGNEILKFENIEIKVPFDYKLYLSMAFGNYMQLPPKEEQVPKHNVVFVDMNKSYLDYKGIHYCIGDKDEL